MARKAKETGPGVGAMGAARSGEEKGSDGSLVGMGQRVIRGAWRQRVIRAE